MRNPEVAEATVRTPWGPAAELRERKLHPSSGMSRAEVARNQRERLFGAVVAVVSNKGYEACTVADIVELSGVSRSAFYEHFSNKDECITAAAEEMIELAIVELDQLDENGLPPGPETILERFIALVCAEPAAARVCFVELHAAGRRGEEIADRGSESLARIVAEANSRQSMGEQMKPAMIEMLTGGLGKLVQSRISSGREEELSDLAPGLWAWFKSVEPPPRPLGSPRRQRPGPGPGFEGYTPSERIARAVARVMSKKGYRAMSTDDIAAQAAISLSTFYANFADKRDAVLAALEMSGAQIMALAGPAARRAGDWQQGVRALYEAMFSYFVAEPEMARLATIGVYEAGPQALARRDRVINSLTEMLAPGFEENPGASEVSTEAAAATVYALMRKEVRARGPESLGSVVPLATYITLVGFIGPERATAVANGDRPRS